MCVALSPFALRAIGTRTRRRFHLGSIAFGSLIIAIVQFIRLVLAYLDRKTKAMQVGWQWLRAGRGFSATAAATVLTGVFVPWQDKSKIWKVIFKCVACCLWCFEKCLKFIS